jgi:hypothetical protein
VTDREAILREEYSLGVFLEQSSEGRKGVEVIGKCGKLHSEEVHNF